MGETLFTSKLSDRSAGQFRGENCRGFVEISHDNEPLDTFPTKNIKS